MKATDYGVFLHRSVYSESSLITWFYTKENGLQKFLFRGGKKKAHSLFPMAVCELSFYGRSNSELLNLTAVEGVHPYTFQFNPVASTIAFFIVECIKKSVHLGDKDLDIFHFIKNFSSRLEAQDSKKLLPIQFLVEFSDVLGFRPYLESNEALYFNLDAGEFQNMLNSNERSYSSSAAQLIASILKKEDVSNYMKQSREEALDILLEYYKIHVPAFNDLESIDIVREVLSY